MASGEGTEFIEWDDERYSTGIDRFDDQHKRLFELLNDLHLAMDEAHSEEAVGEILRELERYTEYHFGDEEEFMQGCGYAMDCSECFFDHREVHEEFAEKVSELREKHEQGEYITMEVLMFVRDWLDTHIAGGNQDQNYGEYYQEEVSGDYEYTPGKLKRDRGREEARPETAPDTVTPADTTVSLGSDIHRGPDLTVPEESTAEWFAEVVAEHGDRTMARFRDGGSPVERTFEEFDERARAVAGGLAESGLEPGDRVAIRAGSRYEWAIADVACHLAGLVSAPIPPGVGDERGRAMADVADVDAAVVGPEVSSPDTAGEVFPIEELPTGDTRDLPGFHAAPDETATIVFEGGADGEPVGRALTHRTLRAAVAALGEAFPLEPGHTGACLPSLSGALQRVAAYHLWSTGNAVAFMHATDAPEALGAAQPEVLVGTPEVYRELHEAMQERIDGMSRLKRRLADGVAEAYGQARSEGRDTSFLKHSAADSLVLTPLCEAFGLSEVEYAISGSAGRLDTDLLHFFWGCGVQVSELYGTAGLAGVGTVNRFESFRTGAVGVPMPGVEVALAEDGEVLVRGPNVAAGRLGEAEPAPTRDGWYHTGEHGEFDDEGYLSFVEER